MKDHITVWKIHLKIWLAVLILLVLVIGVIERARAMTSDPAAISFCTVSGAISYPSYTTNEGFWWRCWTNQELYNYLKAYYQAKGGKNGTWMSATGWISRYFFPVAYATGGDISLNMNLTIGGMQNDGASALAYQQALTAALGSGGVLVVNQLIHFSHTKFPPFFFNVITSETMPALEYRCPEQSRKPQVFQQQRFLNPL